MDYKEFSHQIYQTEDPWHFGTSLFEKARHAAMVEFVLANNPSKVIDLGCGEGHFLEHLLRKASAIEASGVELESKAATRCQKRLSSYPKTKIITADLLDFLQEEPGELFDTVVCGDVLYYLPPDIVAAKVVPAIAHLVRKHGDLVISYADINDHSWNVEIFQSHFRIEKQVYIKPVQNPPPWPWMVALLTVKE